MNQTTEQLPRKRIRRCTSGLVSLIASLAFSATAIGQSDDYVNEYWIEYGNEPVEIEQTNNGRTQILSFTDYQDGMLIAELDGGAGEISLPVSDSMARTLTIRDSPMPEVRRLKAGNSQEDALELLRPIAYPLIKFHGIPESFSQLHAPIRSLISSLITTNRLSEAEDVLNRIELDAVDEEYSELAIRLLNAHLDEENFSTAAAMTGKIPVSGKYQVNIRPMVDAADALRAAGKFDAVIPLYRQLVDIVPESSQANINMWLAYSLVLAKRGDEAAELIEKLEEPEPDERTYSLYQLLIGSNEHSQEKYEAALDRLTRGYVRAQTSHSWVPEMLFLIGDCYEQVDFPVPARNAWTELTILYPDSPWAKQAESSLASLPEQNANN